MEKRSIISVLFNCSIILLLVASKYNQTHLRISKSRRRWSCVSYFLFRLDPENRRTARRSSPKVNDDTSSSPPTNPAGLSNKTQRSPRTTKMQTWRRAFTTSITRLNYSPPTASARPVLLRCAKLLQESGENEDRDIRLQGLIRNVRKQKKVAFAEISDGSTIRPVQTILTPEHAAK